MKTSKLYKKTLMLFLLFIPINIIAAINAEIDGIKYRLNDNGIAQVTGCVDDSKTSIEIPSIVYYEDKVYSVTSINEKAFYNKKTLTSVNLPNTINSIGKYAFGGCEMLANINIPEESVYSIGYGSFHGCSSLTNIIIPNSVTSIGDYAFYGCSGLTNIIIPNSVTSIGDYTFYGCSGLTNITIPNSVTKIGSSAFSNCSGLISITIGNGVTNIGVHAFSFCRNLTNIIIPNSVTSIGDYAFSGCSGLTSATIGSGVTNIGSFAFKDCSNLTNLRIEDRTVALKNLINTELYKSPIETLYIGMDSFKGLISWKSSIKSITLGNNVTSIEDEVFKDYTNLKSVTIPNSVKSIGSKAFQSCTNLTSVAIPNSVISINSHAFQDCKSLKSVTIENGVRIIGEYAFYSCSNLASISIPNSVTSIGNDAFSYCSSLTSAAIPNSVTSIGEYAFKSCSSLASISISNSVTSISKVFDSCDSLKSVHIPDNVTDISWAFYGCKSLESVVIGKKVTQLGFAFSDCVSLKKVFVNIKKPLGCSDETFRGLDSTAVLYVPYGAKEEYSRGLWNYDWTMFSEIREIYFSGDSIIASVNNVDTKFLMLENGENDVQLGTGVSVAAVNEVKGDYHIPISVQDANGVFVVTGIGKNAFKDCDNLTSVFINNHIKYIKPAFGGCNNLKSITIDNRFPSNVEVTEETFNGLPEDVILYVPAGTYERYSSHKIWGKFAQIIELGPISIGDIKTLSGSKAELPIYLKNTKDIAALQFELTLPEGVSVSKSNEEFATSLTERSEGITIMSNKDPDSENCYLFVALSFEGKTFTGNEGTIMNVNIDIPTEITLGHYEVKLENIIMATSSFETLSPLSTSSELEIAKRFNLVYLLDGQEYKQMSVTNGDSIVDVKTPVKEGCTFGGWSEIPAVMPAKDLTITGTFIPNKYQIIYELDGNAFHKDSIVYGSEIVTPDAPVKEWYDFSGWVDVPETMPANNLKIVGNYTLALEMGDVNGDDRISVVDITILTNRILKKDNDIFIDATADLNGDGRISIVDITMATNKIIEK